MLVLVALLVVAAIEMTIRKQSLHWGSFGAGIGAAAGVVALGAAWLATGGWTDYPGPPMVALVFAGCFAFAAEIVLRGWIVQRALEFRAPAWLAIVIGAAVEAVLLPGGVGAGVFGIGLGLMYVRGGLRAPVCARVAFACGAVLLGLV
ncbi:MAG: hypothetical protein JO257_10145 [Deltaproteobacteria bacterium]|nr:hypothetical protein [Deltaproteobacteria bacterium]